MAVIFKPTSPAAMSMRPFAESLANSLPGKRGVKARIMLGFLMRAVGDGKNVTVTVIEPGGFIGGAFGNIERIVGYYYPEYSVGKVVAMYRLAVPPASTMPAKPSSNVPSQRSWSSYGAGGGIQIGDKPTWGSTHNILPSALPRAFVVPSAILLPTVTGTVAMEKTGNVADDPANRSVLVHRMNAATMWAEEYASPQTPAAYPYGLRLNANPYQQAPEGICYVELAASVLALGNAELAAGSMGCLEWGALEGVVAYQAKVLAVPAVSTEDSVLSVGTTGVPPNGAYPVDTVWPLKVGSRYSWGEVGSDAETTMRCARYSIAAGDGIGESGTPIKVYSSAVPWVAVLDGSGAPDALAPAVPPAMTADYPATQDGHAPVATAWRNLWRMQDVLLWSSHAGEKGGQAAPGETIMGIGTVIARRFRPISKRSVVWGPYILSDPFQPRTMAVGNMPALMTYHDRHTVRFFIDPATGAVRYESLYQFVNCYSVEANDCQYLPGVLDTGMSIGSLGVDQLQAYDVDVLEGFTHSPLLGFTVVTPATGTTPETREPFIACRRSRTLYDLMPAAQNRAEHPAVQGTAGGAQLGPVWSATPPITQLASDGEVLITDLPFDPFPGYPASFPYRVEKRNLTITEVAESEKLVVIGTNGAEVVMQTGNFYPDFGGGPMVPARYEMDSGFSKKQYLPDLVDRGTPVCHYAPGVVAVVVIPNAQCPAPRPYWPWPPPFTSPQPISPTPQLYSYSAYGASQSDYDAWVSLNATARVIPSEPATPAPVSQDRYLALCDVRAGELLAVSSKPIYSGIALQDSTTKPHRRANISLSCMEQGARNVDTGEITRHAVLLISVREPIKASIDYQYSGPGTIKVTADFGDTISPIAVNTYAIAAHYLGSPIAPAKIGVTTGVTGVHGKPA